MRRLAAPLLAAALGVCALTACQPATPPGTRPILILATVDPTGCRPPGFTFGGRWLVTFHRIGLYRMVGEGYTPTAWAWQATESSNAYQLPGVRPWWVEEYPGTRVSVITNYLPAHNCGVYLAARGATR